MIKYLDGDLFELLPQEPVVIAHVCNNKGAWGSGFVLPLAAKYPVAKHEYVYWYDSFVVYKSKERYRSKCYYEDTFGLGATQIVSVHENVYVANMVAQILGGKRPLYYNHLCKCMDTVAKKILDANNVFPNNVWCPQFGAGLAGGDWNIIEKLIEDCWIRAGINVTIVRYKK